MMRERKDIYQRLRWLPMALAGCVLAFLMLPILVVIPSAFNASPMMAFPPEGWTLKWFRAFLEDPAWTSAFMTSVRIGAIVAVLSSLTGLMAALVITRTSVLGANLFKALVMGPLIMPVIVVAVALYFAFNRLGINGQFGAVVIGHLLVTLPYTTNVIATALEETDRGLERAAMGLGARPVTAFVLVTLPAIAPSVAIAALFAFLISFDEVVISAFVTGADTYTLPRQLWDSIRYGFNPTIAAVSAILIALSSTILLLTEFLRRAFGAKKPN